MIGRIPVLDVQPRIDCGRRPAKAVPGETFRVTATVFREGHEAVAANVVLRDPDGRAGPWTPMRELAPGSDRYGADVTPGTEGRWTYAVEAWSDPVTTWLSATAARLAAARGESVAAWLAGTAGEDGDAGAYAPHGEDGEPAPDGGSVTGPHTAEVTPTDPAEATAEETSADDVVDEVLDDALETALAEGAALLERAAGAVPRSQGRPVLREAARTLRDRRLPAARRFAAARSAEVAGVLARFPLRDLVTSSRPLPLLVERERALFGAWYEMFPRSEGALVEDGRPVRHGTLRTAAERLDAIAAMGFDVVYLPPIHPIGETHRKGPGGALTAGPEDVGCPWAVGGPAGGHDAVHPDLGTLRDFDHFVSRASAAGLEVALDLALQCSPDHPWVKEHPEWFRHRADGSVACAENPPKVYEDIYPLDFEQDFAGLVRETLRVLRFWMARGVRIFRVDNPHTKPVVFWEKVLGEINRAHPDVVFLAEAFTRPAMVHTLAQVGFQQSYTYFTWRTTRDELTAYLTELTGPSAAYLRPNLFVNTPDILHAYLQEGGRPAFEVRAVLAATLAPSWGMYAGYELCEATPAAPGSEEYADSEKYQLRPRDWAAAERTGRSLAPLVTRLNELRRAHPALRWLRNLRFHDTDNPHVLAYSKRAEHPHADTVLVVVNLDPHHTHEATVSLDMTELGVTAAQLSGAESFPVTDELTGTTYDWGRDNYVRLEPGRADALTSSAHILTLRPSSSDRRVTHHERQ